MLSFSQYQNEPTIISHREVIGDGVCLLHDANARMVCTIERSTAQDAFGEAQPTLRIAGANRRSDEWFGLEIDLTAETDLIALKLRAYPALRLFPRLHFDLGPEVRHLDLPDIAACDVFASIYFQDKQWRSHIGWPEGAARPRLMLLVPSTPWFIFELMSIERRMSDDA